MPSDPIRDALVEVVERYREAASRWNHTDLAVSVANEDRATGAQAALQAYDQAKFALGDTADAETIEVKRSRTRRKK